MNSAENVKETSAGAIVYTLIDNEPHYLLIKDFHNNFGFPKGHLEEDETLKQAAIREIKEEAGIDIDLDTDFKEELNYVMPNGKAKTSIYFIGSYEDQTPVKQPEEVKEILLLPYNEALKVITFENMKEAFVKADAYLRRKL
ncbi:MAG: NUDIX domain-containing protein [Erysipelotrichaceae bacterium]|nr:NUDIX domain-containing protein [Erysipelotrichaceae bacterium]